MSKYYDWKINYNADDIIWIKQKDDGTLKVIADYCGYWKLPQDTINAIFDVNA
jgi:GTP-dependent phosphoenolpyruvate carboxykinase